MISSLFFIAAYLFTGVMVRAAIGAAKRILFREEADEDANWKRCGEDAALFTFLMVVIWPLTACFWLVVFSGKLFFLVSRAIYWDIVRKAGRHGRTK